MHPYFIDQLVEQHRRELLRSAEAWRLAHPVQTPTPKRGRWIPSLPWRRAPGLLVARVAVLARVVTLRVGSSRVAARHTTIVLGACGPEEPVYRVPGGPSFELTIENRSELTWVPWTGLAEKDSWCHLLAGQAQPNPCTVGPHSTIVLRPPSVATGATEIYFAPPGLDWQKGVRAIVDVVAQPCE